MFLINSDTFTYPPHYENHTIINVSLDTVNINEINISTLYSRVWQHFNSNWTSPHLQKWANVAEVSIAQFYKHMINTPHMDNLNASWYINGEYWYDFHCTCMCLQLQKILDQACHPKCQPYSQVSS